MFASGRGGARFSRPAPHYMRGEGAKFGPRTAPEHPGPRTGNGAGDNSGGPRPVHRNGALPVSTGPHPPSGALPGSLFFAVPHLGPCFRKPILL